VVYAALIDNQKNAMFYKTSKNFLEKKGKPSQETHFINSEFEGKNIKDNLINNVFKLKKQQGEDYFDPKFKINIYKIAQPIIINDELWGVVVLGFSLENLYKEISAMQDNFKVKIVQEKNRLQSESIKQKVEEIDKIKKNLTVIQKNIRKDVRENAYYYFIGFSIPGLILAFLFGKNIAKPIISMVPVLQKISKGILTDKIKMRRNDEIKILGDGINTMIDELNSMISTINGIIKSITSENQNLLNFSRHTTTTIDTISGNINEIEVGVLNNSMDVNATADRLKRFVDTLSQMTQNVITLNQNAETTENVSNEGKESFNNLLSKMENIEDGFKQTDTLVTELSKFSFEIKDIIKVIEDIATRTRMLAYSVNVIAQKGGQQDKSITNIAVEVRNLSKFISDYSSNIMKLMDNNNVLIEKIFNSTKAGLKNIESGIMTSNILMNSMNEIVEKVNTDKVMINDISNMIADIDKESKTIFASTENISQVSSQMSNLITSTAKAIYEERETIKQLNYSVNKLKDIADSLRNKMKEFTINE
ncbi:methyl-accepting chemotaxis protein, partial [Candidatus Dependentiae bacterium]|nr:methyl-accepting chemotaxis protein [Candidatus Dependentiae bacterium]